MRKTLFKRPTWEEVGIAAGLMAMVISLLIALAATPAHAQVYGATTAPPPSVAQPCQSVSFFSSATYITQQLRTPHNEFVQVLEEANNEAPATCTTCIFDRNFHIRAGILCAND
jgi:hypothetical protein